MKKQWKIVFSFYVFSIKITNQLSLKYNFQNVDQQAERVWFIYGTKHHKDNKFQSQELPWRIPYKLRI